MANERPRDDKGARSGRSGGISDQSLAVTSPIDCSGSESAVAIVSATRSSEEP